MSQGKITSEYCWMCGETVVGRQFYIGGPNPNSPIHAECLKEYAIKSGEAEKAIVIDKAIKAREN